MLADKGRRSKCFSARNTEARDVSTLPVGVPLEMLAVLFFYLITFVFVGLGQVLGRAFDEARDRLRAYISNVVGSLAGIAVFALASYLWTTPMVWFAVVMMIWLYLLKRRTLVQVYWAFAVLLVMGFVSYSMTLQSPYQTHPSLREFDMVAVLQDRLHTANQRMSANNIGHQQMVLDPGGRAGL